MTSEQLDDQVTEPQAPAVIAAWWVSRDGNEGTHESGTEDLTETLDRGNDMLRVTAEFFAAWQESIRHAEATMNLGLVIMPTAEDVLLPSRY